MFRKTLSRRSFLTVSAMTAAAATLDMKQISAWADAIEPKRDYPTVIIGTGLGGLCCGAYLAKAGIPVTMVEQHSVPGGYATAFDRMRGKYRFEVSLHGTSIHNNAPARILENIGILDKIERVSLPEVYRLKAPGLEISVPQCDPEAYIDILVQHFPHEAEGIRQFVHEMIALNQEVEDYGQRSEFYKKATRIAFPVLYKRMWHVRNKTLSDLLDRSLHDPSAKAVLSALWGYYGLPPSKLSGFYYANPTGGYLKNGSYSIKTRSQDLSNTMAEAVESAGGKIIYDTAAESILMEKGAVKGVVLSSGETLPARAVVSNASALTTFKKLLPSGAVPESYMKKISGFRPSLSSFIVWLGVNRELRGKIEGFSTHVSDRLDPEADYADCIKGNIDTVSFSVSVYDNLYPGYSTGGTSTLMLLSLCGYEPWRRFENDYKAGRKAAYHAEKNRWKEILIRRAEASVIPGLSDMIEVAVAATPLTNQRYTGNTDGAIYGFEQSMENAYMNRLDNRTPVKGLYLAGAWGNPGGGYGGVLIGGEQTFRKMMADWT